MTRYLIQSEAVTPEGQTLNTLPGASVSVLNAEGGQAELYAGSTGTTQIPNPIIADENGVFEFWVEHSDYVDIFISYGGETGEKRFYLPTDLPNAIETIPRPPSHYGFDGTPDAAIATQSVVYNLDRGLPVVLRDYLHPDDVMAMAQGDIDGQDEGRNTQNIQNCMDAVVAWYKDAENSVPVVHFPAGTVAINDEIFSETGAQSIWDIGTGDDFSNLTIVSPGTVFRKKNWLAQSRVRTSGYYAANSITDAVPSVVFRWEQFTSRKFSLCVQGNVMVLGDADPATDPIGFKFFKLNTAVLEHLQVDNLGQTGVMFEHCFNSSEPDMQVGNAGYQPTEFGGDGALPSTVRFDVTGTTVTASEPVFTADHVGKWFGVDGAGLSGTTTAGVHWSTIASRTSDTVVELTDAATTNVTSQTASFQTIHGAITAGSNILTLTAVMDGIDLTGRYVSVVGSRADDDNTKKRTLCAVITAHTGNTLTLSRTADITVSDTPVIFSPTVYMGWEFLGTIVTTTDDMGLSKMRVENGGFHNPSVLLQLCGASAIEFSTESKLHGAASSRNNFGGNFSNLVAEYCLSVQFSGVITHGHSPIYGKMYLHGTYMDIKISGNQSSWPTGNLDARWYLDVDPAHEWFRVYDNLTTNRFDNFPTQDYIRTAQDGDELMVFRHGVARRDDATGSVQRSLDGTQRAWASVDATYTSASTLQYVWHYPEDFTTGTDPVVTIAIGNASNATPQGADLASPYHQSGDHNSATLRVTRISGTTDFQSGDTIPMHISAVGDWDVFS